jgi:hypothetical protein
MVSSAAIGILSRLAAAEGDAYLFGRRFEDTPLSMVDPGNDSTPAVDRSVAEELVIAGYLEDESQRGESINVAFRITEKGRVFLASANQSVSPAR